MLLYHTTLVCRRYVDRWGGEQKFEDLERRLSNEFERKEIDFERCHTDFCSHIKKYYCFYTTLLLYVNDMLIVGVGMHKIESLKRRLLNEFEMKDICVE